MRGQAQDRFGEALVALPVELARRRRYDRRAEVLFVEANAAAPGLPGGSICVVSGEPDEPLMREIREAADRGDAAAVAKVLRAHEERLEKAGKRISHRVKEHSVDEAVASLPAITEVRYRGKPIAEGMVVHQDMRAMRVLVPYAGGKLDPEGFTASTFVHGRKAPEVETIVVVREPELSPMEEKVLDRLPKEVNQLVIGDPSIVANWGLAAAGLVFVAVVVGGVLLARYAQEQMRQHEQQANREMERNLAGEEGQQQINVQDEQGEAQIEAHQQQEGQQQEGQQQEGQQQEGQQQEGQVEAQQEEAGEDQAEHEQEANGGRLSWFVDEAELSAQLEQVTAGAAVKTLVQLRTGLMLQGKLR